MKNNYRSFDSNVSVVKKKPCKFCIDSKLVISYKDPRSLRYFLTERGKIIPRRILGTCAKHQRDLCQEVKRARNLALISFTEKEF